MVTRFDLGPGTRTALADGTGRSARRRDDAALHDSHGHISNSITIRIMGARAGKRRSDTAELVGGVHTGPAYNGAPKPPPLPAPTSTRRYCSRLVLHAENGASN